MKKEDLFELLGDLDDKQIESARKSWITSNDRGLQAFWAIAASLVVFLGSGFLFRGGAQDGADHVLEGEDHVLDSCQESVGENPTTEQSFHQDAKTILEGFGIEQTDDIVSLTYQGQICTDQTLLGALYQDLAAATVMAPEEYQEYLALQRPVSGELPAWWPNQWEPSLTVPLQLKTADGLTLALDFYPERQMIHMYNCCFILQTFDE